MSVCIYVPIYMFVYIYVFVSLRNCPNCCQQVSKPTVKKLAKFHITVSINH